MSSNEGASEKSPLGEIRSDVRHLRSDVTELRSEVRATNQKIDALRVELTDRIERRDAKVDARFDSLEAKMDTKFDSLRTELSGRIERLEAKFDLLKDSLGSAKIWALVLYIGLAGAILITMARGFKWM